MRQNFWDKIVQTPTRAAFFVLVLTTLIVFLITAFWPQLSSHVLPNSALGLYNKSFWENVLVEAHGLVFDIFLIALILVWMDSLRIKKESNQRNLEGLWDLNTFNDEIYQKRKINMIKRLNANNVYQIDVTDLSFKDTDINELKFIKSRLYGLKVLNCNVFGIHIEDSELNSAEFTDSTLKKGTKLLNSYLKNADFKNSTVIGVDFKNSNLFQTKFIGAKMQSADLRGCDLQNTVFEGANLKNMNIKMCKNINCDALAKAECLDYLKADNAIIEVLRELRPDMKINLGQIENRTLNSCERTTA
ncbi:pentapeptide repeat-containing protein [Vibrio fluvialis]|uniref:pentapeptide repeat-containing protein n=1 Tax=Pseudomonadati TaxID=3379134 RepID=UPI001C9CE49E|nr:pentapeptide repeat-containing protein [Vibrio fluvialis]